MGLMLPKLLPIQPKGRILIGRCPRAELWLPTIVRHMGIQHFLGRPSQFAFGKRCRNSCSDKRGSVPISHLPFMDGGSRAEAQREAEATVEALEHTVQHDLLLPADAR